MISTSKIASLVTFGFLILFVVLGKSTDLLYKTQDPIGMGVIFILGIFLGIILFIDNLWSDVVGLITVILQNSITFMIIAVFFDLNTVNTLMFIKEVSTLLLIIFSIKNRLKAEKPTKKPRRVKISKKT